MKKYQNFSSENFQFLVVKFSVYVYLDRRVFVMGPLYPARPTPVLINLFIYLFIL